MDTECENPTKIDVITPAQTTQLLNDLFQMKKRLRMLEQVVFKKTNISEEESLNSSLELLDSVLIVNNVPINSFISMFYKCYETNMTEICGKSRERPIPNKRHMLRWYIRNYYGNSLKSIARLTGNVDHTTILHSLKEAEKLISLYKQDWLPYHNRMISLLA